MKRITLRELLLQPYKREQDKPRRPQMSQAEQNLQAIQVMMQACNPFQDRWVKTSHVSDAEVQVEVGKLLQEV